jgi:hypothetical protein
MKLDVMTVISGRISLWEWRNLTTHSTGARIEWLSSILSLLQVDFIRRARLIRAFGGLLCLLVVG